MNKLVPRLFIEGTLIPTTSPLLYLLAQQCHINQLSAIFFDSGPGLCVFLIAKMSWEWNCAGKLL